MINNQDLETLKDIFLSYSQVGVENRLPLLKIFKNKRSIEDAFENILKNFEVTPYMQEQYKHYMELLTVFKNEDNYPSQFLRNENYNPTNEQFKIYKNMPLLITAIVDFAQSKWNQYAEHLNISTVEEFASIDNMLKKYIDSYSIYIANFYNDFALIESDMTHLMKKVNDIRERDINFIENEFLRVKKIILNTNMIEKHKNLTLEEILPNKQLRELITNILKEFENIYTKGKLVSNNYSTLAEESVDALKITNESVSEFLSKKSLSEHLILDLDSKLGSFKNMKIYDDYSMVITHNNNQAESIFSNFQAKHYVKEMFIASMKYDFRKTPKIASGFIDLINDHPKKITEINILATTFLNNAEILKANKFNILKELNDMTLKLKNLQAFMNFNTIQEALDDKMNHIIKDHKVKQYAHSIISNKYTHLYDEKTYIIMKSLYDLKINTTVLQDNIGKKIAAYQTPEEFNDALGKLLNSFNKFTAENIIHKANECNSFVIMNTDDKVILKINSFEESTVMGSSSWCISRSEYYFNSYKGNKNNQYFIYDFSKDSFDNDSMIGITVTPELTCSAAHLKNDDSLTKKSKIKEILNDIEKYDILSYKMLEENKYKEKKQNYN